MWIIGLVGMCAVQVSKLILPEVQQTFLRQFHLKDDHFSRWAVLQSVPTMYSFANELWWSGESLSADNLFFENHDITERYYLWLNHFPLHFVTYNHYRDVFFRDDAVDYIYLRSRFRGQSLITRYLLDPKQGTLRIIRLDEQEAR